MSGSIVGIDARGPGGINSYLNEPINCMNNTCIIDCNSDFGCLLSDIIMYDNGLLLLSCTNELSCFSATISSTASSENAEYIIFCKGDHLAKI